MTYEYICTACNHEWEASQSINDAPLKDCPKCDKATAKRQISGGTGFLLKGGGWYSDGYASASAKKKTEKSETSESSAKSSDSKSSDSKSSDSKSSDSKKGSGSGASTDAA